METAGADAGHAARQAHDLDRRETLVSCAVTQLAIFVPSPALGAAVRQGRTGVASPPLMVATSGLQPTTSVGSTRGERAIAELAMVVITPALCGATREPVHAQV